MTPIEFYLREMTRHVQVGRGGLYWLILSTQRRVPCRQLLQRMQKILELGRVVEEFFCGGTYTVDAFTR